MKQKLPLTAAVLIIFMMQTITAQIVTLENLPVPDSGYYNGSTDHSGTVGSTETFYYTDQDATFNVTYTLEDSYDYWSGFAYSNQTDLNTANYTNYSAYSPAGGGAGGSSNYIFAYIFGAASMTFDVPVTLSSVAITNTVWAYRYMNGTDGVGTGTYEDGDYFKLKITGLNADGEDTLSLDFYLADFTGGNSNIVGDWTTVDLTSLGVVSGLKFELEALDNYTPYYFCMDNLAYSTLGIEESILNEVSIYPNPAENELHISQVENAVLTLFDLQGHKLQHKEHCDLNEKMDVSQLNPGVYFLTVTKNQQTKTQKIIVK